MTAHWWSAVFAQAIKEAEYWAREFATPATLLLAKHRRLLDRSSSPKTGDDRQNGSRAEAKRKRSGPKKKYKGEDKSLKENGIYTVNRKGLPVCIRPNK